MNNLEEIKQRKIEEIRQNHEKQKAEVQAEQQLNGLMRQVLTDKAKARLGNIKIVNKELYFRAVQAIIYLYKAGQISGKLSDEQLKELLKKLREKKDIKIKRK